MVKILFLCHGNICRSVAAEIIALNSVKKYHLEDKFLFLSRALSNEEYGNDIYPPMKRELLSRGYTLKPHFAQKVSKEELEEFDHIFYMDNENQYLLERYFGNLASKCELISVYSDNLEIEDPWYTNRYYKVVDQIEKAVLSIINHLS